MDHDQIDALARKAGVLDHAVQDARNRVLARFVNTPPDPATVERWLRQLAHQVPELFPPAQTVWEKLHMTEEAFNKLPPTTRWALDRQHNPQPVTTPHPNRPVTRPLTPGELDSIKDLPFHERHTRGRLMQQTPLPQG